MAELDIERRGSGFPWWAVALVGALALLIVLGLVLSRPASTRSPELNPNDVAQVLRYGNLPETFAYGGLTWRSAESGRFADRNELIRIGPVVGGHPVYYRRGTATNPYQALYLPAEETGQHADVFVRYQPMEETGGMRSPVEGR